jgi:uncharacterized oxidoreductase
MRISQNKILVTGATAGIGEALLNKFLSLDNQIIAVGRNEEKLQTLAQRDKRVIPLVCDISKAKDLDKLILFVEQSIQIPICSSTMQGFSTIISLMKNRNCWVE